MLPVFFLAAALGTATMPDDTSNRPPEVGEVFPDLAFTMLGEEGLRSLSDFRGTRVLLIQFASW